MGFNLVLFHSMSQADLPIWIINSHSFQRLSWYQTGFLFHCFSTVPFQISFKLKLHRKPILKCLSVQLTYLILTMAIELWNKQDELLDLWNMLPWCVMCLYSYTNSFISKWNIKSFIAIRINPVKKVWQSKTKKSASKSFDLWLLMAY